MVFVRSQKLKTGTFHYVITGRHDRPLPCGRGSDGREYAHELAAEIRKVRRDQRTGKYVPPPTWTLEELKAADLQDAKNRGLVTAQPQFQGKLSKRESHWKNLLAFFRSETTLDQVTETRIRAYIAHRQKTVGPVPINRDLFGVLRPALRLARETEAAGYHADPFARIRKLDERTSRRAPIVLAAKDATKLIRIARALRKDFGAWVEIQLLTASRRGQVGAVDGAFLRYPPHKRGIARSFRLEGRLAVVVRQRRAFSPGLWADAAKELGRPDLHPHDLRHTALTIEGSRPGATLESIRKLGGWRSAAMADVYLHDDARAIGPVQIGSKRKQ